MPTHLCNKHVYNMNFCRWPVVRSSVDGRPTPKMSPDCRPMDGRWSTDAKQKCSHEWSAVHIFNVNARRRPIWESRTG